MPNQTLKKIIAEIKASGPMAVDRYMELCNTHYYATRDPFGAKGDFTTAPEISQIFGEMLGVWAIMEWEKLKRPKKIAIMELGPGRGTLMADLLRAIKLAPEFQPEIHLVEFSPTLREMQKKTLSKHKVEWHEEIPKLNMKTLVIANEFFDALPIKQYTPEGERLIYEKDGELFFNANDVSIELSPLSKTIMQDISASTAAGAIIDYGYFTPKGADTLQAVKDHKYHNVLEDPGEADLTAHVNFAELAANCLTSGNKKPRLMTQREFLLAYGADVRAKILGKENDLERLIAPGQMGELFKVLCF
jgi:SAM-dependent MidA family methyltransferase